MTKAADVVKFVPSKAAAPKTPLKTGYDPMEPNYIWYSDSGNKESTELAKNMFNYKVF